MDEEKPEPKISLPEALITGPLFFVGPDIIEFALVFVGLDDFWISDAFAFPGSQIYLRMKGMRGIYTLAANVVELIPYVGWIPWRTLAFGITLWLDRHPKAVEKVAKVAAVTGVAAKAGGKPPIRTTQGVAEQGVVEGTREATPAAGRAAGGIGEEAGGAAAKETAAAGKEISPEALGEEKLILEKLKEPMEELPQPEQKKEPLEQLSEPRENKAEKDQKETIGIDDKNNQIDLRKAA